MASDPNFFENTLAQIISVHMPRPDLQARVVYPARMPSRGDLANLRRLSGRVAEAFSGSPRAGEILGKETSAAFAGAPVTVAVDIANPPPSDQYPVVPASNVRVNLYAVYQPAWQKRAKLAEMVQRWRQIRDEELPMMGRPVRQMAFFQDAAEGGLSGIWLMPSSVSLQTGKAAYCFARPRARVNRGGRVEGKLDLPDLRGRLRGKTVFDLMREFNEQQVEVLLVGSEVLDRVEDGAVVSFPWRAPHGGNWLLSATVDAGDEIFERDEGNNSAEAVIRVRPTPHYFANTPPLAIAGVRVGRGEIRSKMVETVLERLAGDEPAMPRVAERWPVDRGTERMWQELRDEMESRTAGMPALAKRRAISIRQGQLFTLIGSRSVDREHDICCYHWSGPNVSFAGPRPNLAVDTSQPGYELSPGVHRFTLTVRDGSGLVASDDVFVTVSGGPNSADLMPIGMSTAPGAVVADRPVSVSVAVTNRGGAATSKAFKIRLMDGATQLAERQVDLGLAGGDTIEVCFEDAWTPDAGLHRLSVIVDPTNQVAEANSTNNILRQTFNIDANAAPVADLGSPRFTVKAGEALFLDAYRSYDPDGRILRYEWSINGQLQQGEHARRFRYVAPNRRGQHQVKLVVADNHTPRPKLSEAFEAIINVVSERNLPPVIQLPPRILVTPGSRTPVIPAVGCYDGDGAIVKFLWKARGLVNSYTGRDLAIPIDKARSGVYTAELEVTDDDGAEAYGSTRIYVVERPNRAPVIQVTGTVGAIKGERAVLDASRSYDVDGQVAEYLWIVTRGGSAGTGPRFEIDTAALGVGVHLVVLAVSDDKGATTTRPVFLIVLPIKGQPAASDTGYDPRKPIEQNQLQKIESGKPAEPGNDGKPRPPGDAERLGQQKESPDTDSRK